MLRHAVDDLVARCLRRELRTRKLLLSSAELSSATCDAASSGGILFHDLMTACFSGEDLARGRMRIEFDESRTQPRIIASLAFGATTARLLGGSARSDLLCGAFNLGIGLVDGLCDNDRDTGLQVLQLLHAADLSGACRERRTRGWLTAELPHHLAADAAVAFTVRVVEVFFDMLHVNLPGDRCADLRDTVGGLVMDALDAESGSMAGLGHAGPPEELINRSHMTSVLPFAVLEHLARGGDAGGPTSPAGPLGEAMWLIDDLVDLTQDVSTGALNAVVVAATASHAPSAVPDPLRVLDRVLASRIVPPLAARAADCLDRGLRAAEPTAADHARIFVSFVQRYAGLVPAVSTTDNSSLS